MRRCFLFDRWLGKTSCPWCDISIDPFLEENSFCFRSCEVKQVSFFFSLELTLDRAEQSVLIHKVLFNSSISFDTRSNWSLILHIRNAFFSTKNERTEEKSGASKIFLENELSFSSSSIWKEIDVSLLRKISDVWLLVSFLLFSFLLFWSRSIENNRAKSTRKPAGENINRLFDCCRRKQIPKLVLHSNRRSKFVINRGKYS